MPATDIDMNEDSTPTALRESLTPRLRETLDHLLAGRTERIIAELMGISQHTVHDHVKALYRLFKVTSRPQLLALWVRDKDM